MSVMYLTVAQSYKTNENRVQNLCADSHFSKLPNVSGWSVFQSVLQAILNPFHCSGSTMKAWKHII